MLVFFYFRDIRDYSSEFESELLSLTRQQMSPILANEGVEFKDELFLKSLREGKNNEKIWVAFEEGKLVGYVFFRIEQDRIYISSIIIADHFKGKGCGSFLLKKVEEYAVKNNIPKVGLRVQPSNASARSFYEKRGFKGTGSIVLNWGEVLEKLL